MVSVMVIDPGNNINTQSQSTGRARQQQAGAVDKGSERPAAQSDVKKNDGDSVSLSSASLSIAKVEAKLSELGDVDAAKVAEVKSAISSGSYKIDADAIADKISVEESQLG